MTSKWTVLWRNVLHLTFFTKPLQSQFSFVQIRIPFGNIGILWVLIVDQYFFSLGDMSGRKYSSYHSKSWMICHSIFWVGIPKAVVGFVSKGCSILCDAPIISWYIDDLTVLWRHVYYISITIPSEKDENLEGDNWGK